MCKDCGCSEKNKAIIEKMKLKTPSPHSETDHSHEHDDGHHHDHDHHNHEHDESHPHHAHKHDDHSHHHGHHHDHEHDDCDHTHEDHNHNHHKNSQLQHSQDSSHTSLSSKSLLIKENVLDKNDQVAHSNRQWLNNNNIISFNFISSPGSGKTFLLEKSIEILSKKFKIAIIVGDLQTNNDALRMMDKGADVLQLNTHSSCHLNSQHIADQLGKFVKPEHDLLFIENVGNLVCPAAFDLGEHFRVALLSTTEGEDKPIKYPVLFNSSDVILITKTDLIPHLTWSKSKCQSFIEQVNSKAPLFFLSAKSEEGFEEWISWLEKMFLSPENKTLAFHHG